MHGEEDAGYDVKVQGLGNGASMLAEQHRSHQQTLPNSLLVHMSINKQTNIYHCLPGARLRGHRD